MKEKLLEQTNFNGLKELIQILTDEHPLVLLFGESARDYVEFTSTGSSTRYRFWWNKKNETWEVQRLGGEKSLSEPKAE
jgi:hypothetical protein